jgi:hypothetical protein
MAARTASDRVPLLTRWSRPGSTDAVPARPIDGILAKTGLDLTLP